MSAPYFVCEMYANSEELGELGGKTTRENPNRNEYVGFKVNGGRTSAPPVRNSKRAESEGPGAVDA